MPNCRRELFSISALQTQAFAVFGFLTANLLDKVATSLLLPYFDLLFAFFCSPPFMPPRLPASLATQTSLPLLNAIELNCSQKSDENVSRTTTNNIDIGISSRAITKLKSNSSCLSLGQWQCYSHCVASHCPHQYDLERFLFISFYAALLHFYFSFVHIFALYSFNLNFLLKLSFQFCQKQLLVSFYFNGFLFFLRLSHFLLFAISLYITTSKYACSFHLNCMSFHGLHLILSIW